MAPRRGAAAKAAAPPAAGAPKPAAAGASLWILFLGVCSTVYDFGLAIMNCIDCLHAPLLPPAWTSVW